MKNKLFIIIGILFLITIMNNVSAINYNCNEGLVSWWRLNTGSGTTAYDYCGRNNGTLTNGVTWTVNGIQGYGVNFDGVNDYISITSTQSINLTGNYTIALWVKPSVIGTTDILLSKKDAYRIRFPASNPDRIEAGFYRAGWKAEISGDLSVSENNWTFITATYNPQIEPENISIYLNGTLNTTSTSGFTGIGAGETSTNPLLLGADLTSGSWYNGIIDEVLIFNKTLNATEINQVYQTLITPCAENWIAQYTTCNTSDNRTKYYIDENSCETNYTLPIDNGTTESCNYCTPTWQCSIYDQSCGDTPPQPDIITCLNITSTNYATCCALTNLTTDCTFTGNTTEFNKLCGNISVILEVEQYPYVDVNTNYSMNLYLLKDGIPKNYTEFKININNQTLNFTWNPTNQRYEKTILFTTTGDYPFIINAVYPYDAIQNITGTFLVRNPYYLDIEFYTYKDLEEVNKYENDLAWVLVEYEQPRSYDQLIENYISPLFFKQTFKEPVFHGRYIDGHAQIKLFDANQTYHMRLVDGDMTFTTILSPPNITKTYGTNVYVGKYTFNGTDIEMKIYLQEKEIHQFRWLINIIFIILLIAIIAVSAFLFFMIPTKPTLSIIFGIGFTTMLIIARITLWFWQGW